MMKKKPDYLTLPTGLLLVFSFVLFFVLSWVLLLRDGRAMYAIIDFYPKVNSLVKFLEPLAVRYKINSIPTIAFLLTVIFSFLFYFISLKQKINLKNTVIFSLIFQFIIFFSYPVLATDIFSYILSDRVSTVYHQNVWKVAPIKYDSDPFSRLADWKKQTRVYGGVNQFFYNFASEIGGNDLISLVISYKLLVWIFTIATMFVFYKTIIHSMPGNESIFMRLIFWNPLFVLETLGSGHNDILMIFFSILSYHFFLKKKYVFSGSMLAFAIQIKLIVVLLFPFLVLSLMREKKIKPLIFFCSSLTAVNLGVFYFMQISPFLFLRHVSFNIGVYWQSLPALVHRFYNKENLIFSTGLLFTYAFFLFYQYNRKKDALTMYAFFIFCYLLFFASAYWNWYVLWIFCFLPFIRSRKLQNAIIVFTFTSILAYPLLWISLRFNHNYILWPIFIYFVVFIIPMIVFLKMKEFSFFPVFK